MSKRLFVAIAGLAVVIAIGAVSGAVAGKGKGGKKRKGGQPTDFTVKVENLSTATSLPTSVGPVPLPISPGVFAVYNGQNPLYRVGKKADEGTERIAEDGVITKELATLIPLRKVTDGGLFEQPGGPLGPAFEPGSETEFGFTARRGQRFSLEAMFVQSNDWFYGTAGKGVKLFKGKTPVSGDITSRIRVYDAGTEVDEEPGNGTTAKPNQGPTAEDVGPSEDERVQLYNKTGDGFTIPALDGLIRVTITPGG
jgi:hypothetical protein